MDVHFLGEFNSISDAWKMYPNGGGFGDYITVNGVRVDWSEYTNSWGEPDPVTPPYTPPAVVDGDLDVNGQGSFNKITTGDYVPGTSGAAIDEFGNGEFRTVKIDSLYIKNAAGDLVLLSDYIKTFKTELPPAWDEYSKTPLFDDIRLLVFDANSNEKYYTTVGDLKNLIKDSAGTGGGGELNIQILRSDDIDSTPTDNNVFSALRTLLEIRNRSLSKINSDSAYGLIKFLEGLEVGEFISGMLGGKGMRADKSGNIEATSLRLRALLEVPELRYNRLTVIGDELILTENGLIHTVEEIGERSYQLNMKLEEGEAISFISGDLVKGIFHHPNGFATSYMIVSEVGQTFMKATLANDADVPTPYNLPPQDFMNIARVGNISDIDRQRYMVFSSKLGGYQLYDGCSDFLSGRLVASFDTAQSFKHLFDNLPLREGLPYIYAAGLVVEDIIRIDYQGVPVREVYDRGPWEAERTYYNNDEQGTDDVWHYGCRWRCFSSSTTEEPRWDSSAWIMIEGNPDFTVDFMEMQNIFDPDNFNATLTVLAKLHNQDVTDDIRDTDIVWTRYSEDLNGVERVSSDNAWAQRHAGAGKSISLTADDADFLGYVPRVLRFTATVTLRDGITGQANIEYR